MTDLGALVQEGLGVAVMAVLPLMGAALGGSLVAGWLGGRLGLTDPVGAMVLRGLAVLGALWLVADGLAGQAQELTAESWAGLTAVGRADR